MSDTSPLEQTKFERFVEHHLDDLVFFVVIVGMTQLTGRASVAAYPGLATAEVWVQIGWGMLIGLSAVIPALILAGLTRKWARQWATRRFVNRHVEWLAEQWGVDHD